MDDNQWTAVLIAAGVFLLHVFGLLHIMHVLMRGRTSQGTIAWIVCMMVIPWVAIPFYWVAGRRRFSGYVRARRAEDRDLRKLSETMYEKLRKYELKSDDAFGRAAEILGGLPFTRGNSVELLVDGEETFDSIFASIQSAKHYILVNFFIVKSDELGSRFQKALIDKARSGVKVYLLFDEFGSHKLPRDYLNELEDSGVEWSAFGANRFWWSRLQINFRNHRKIVVVDGDVAFIGGLNVGDEYMGRDEKFGKWRDTHIKLTGPSVQAIQLVFLEDWNWAGSKVPDLRWGIDNESTDQTVAILPTGPADPADSWQLLVAEACNTATDRLWIASPYFVPDQGVLTALQAAAIRGVDVRILIPDERDHWMVWLAAFTFYEETIPYGIKLMRYEDGFLHQKVMLVDDRYAFVGTANLDNRSFRLNFEITAVCTDSAFVQEVWQMLGDDFIKSRKVEMRHFERRPFWFKLVCRIARLMAPIL